jgi:hypothetical protein
MAFSDIITGAIAFFLSVWFWLIPIMSSQAAESTTTSPAETRSAETDTAKHADLDADDISSEKVSQFVHAYLQVMDLIDQRESELSGAETESESLQMQRDIEATALTLIEESGLTWQEYIQLLGLANSDPEFSERIAAQLEEAIGS